MPTKKIAIGSQTLLYPMPAVLVGADIAGKPNFMTAAWCGIVNSTPPTLSVSLQHHRHTLKGIRENNTFSINVPSVDQAVEVDYCGIYSGNKVDKVEVCHFEVFHGKLGTAPLIGQCPVNLECRVLHQLNLGSHILVVGQIEEIHVTESCLTNGVPDPEKIRPIIYASGQNKAYYSFGEPVGAAFSIGTQLKKG